MADPVNNTVAAAVAAAASTSANHRKRVLPAQQPPVKAKRPRNNSNNNAIAAHQQQEQQQTNSASDNKKNPTSRKLHDTAANEPSSSSSLAEDPVEQSRGQTHGSIPSIRKSPPKRRSTTNESDSSTKPLAKTRGKKDKATGVSFAEAEPGPSTRSRHSSPIRSRRLTRSKSRLIRSAFNDSDNESPSSKYNLRHGSNHSSRQQARNSESAATLNNGDTTVGSSRALNGIVLPHAITHKYELRSQGQPSFDVNARRRAVSDFGSGGVSAGGGAGGSGSGGAAAAGEEDRQANTSSRGFQGSSSTFIALGAATSHANKREEPLPSRLTRTGAVLRRSTRNTKTYGPTTGSCASSSGASGSGGRGSGRAARQHKVGAAAPAPPPHVVHATSTQSSSTTTTTTTTAAAIATNHHHQSVLMAADQSEMPNNGLTGTEEPPSPQEGAQAMTTAVSGAVGSSGPNADSESDDSEVGRLQALLEARGLPPHLFGALGPRMQHLLHRSMGANSSATKAQQLLQGLQALGDEGQQLQAVIEMCQMLVMGNEDTLTGFPVKQVVPALINLLHIEHNFDMMNHACRALTYMMEALPRSSAVVVDAVPVFLQKLQVIQCMDVAEQSLTALDMLSRRHSKAILQARGVSACLTYLDFFSINAQRNALSVTANCCLNLTNEEFQYVVKDLSLLANRLTQPDKKSVECVCLAFSRLVDSFQSEPTRLQEIASSDLLTNLQQLLAVTPPVISTGTFITVLRMLSVMCANCPDLALTLLKQNIAETLLYLLTGSVEANQDEVELIQRQPQELYEITSLIAELMPKLPTDGIFAVDALLERQLSQCKDQPVWQWRDDRGIWHQYGAVDSRMIEAAHMNGDDEVSLNTLGRTYTIDFPSMQQINEDSGTTRAVQRRFASSGGTQQQSGGAAGVNATSSSTIASLQPSSSTSVSSGNRSSSASRDARVACLREERGLAASFIRSLFSVLYEVYSSSAGPTVRCKCLKALLRMVYYGSPDLLKEVLKNQVVSSHIAGMMASSDLRIVVGALQMADILMSKLPDVFGVHFRREGVMHQINQLADPNIPLGSSLPNNASSATSFSISNDNYQAGPSHLSTDNTGSPLNAMTANGSATAPNIASSMVTTAPHAYNRVEAHRANESDMRTPSPSHVRLTDVLKRKRAGKRGATTGSSGARSKSRPEEVQIPASIFPDFYTKTPTGNTCRQKYLATSSKASSFLQSLNPARWGRNITTSSSSSSSSHDRAFGKDSCLGKSSSSSNLTAGNREKARVWIRDQSSKFIDIYSCNELTGQQHPALNVLAGLKSCIQKLSSNECHEALIELRDILLESDISPFEVNHSGLIKALLTYLASSDNTNNNDEGHCFGGGTIDRDQRLRIFLNVFAGLPVNARTAPFGDVLEINSSWMGALVAKLNGCVSQLEQFPVKVHDLPAGSGGGRGGTSALKFFNTHQLKCNLQRHPDCTNLKQWKGGTVKIDPLALVQAIERYLVVRGYGRIRDDSADSDDGDSDDDIDDTLAAVVISQAGSKHKLQFLMGNTVLPYNMTVYQAVRQFGNNGNDQSETDTDNETPLGNAGVWVQTHTIFYRPLREDPNAHQQANVSSAGTSHASRKGKGSSSKSASRRKGDDLWNEGIVPPIQSSLTPFLTTSLPDSVTIQDASLEALCLLRILNALNLYWNTLYPTLDYKCILPASDFLNSKVAAKANRQLQDPLVIMTGNLPNWLQQIATVCPFLFPFETRQLLFYATSFDRDRALQRLLDMTPELSSNDSQERVTPRLDRRKRVISRDDILKQAESVMQDLATSKALLEVQYENEVGTGLGPTLEFYALVSRELQRSDLELWHNSNNNNDTGYVHHPVGLFPAPLSRSAKVSQLTKIKTKFRFLGRFMAKAVMDSRMLDLPFSLSFYRWLLGQEHCLSMVDLCHVSPDIYRTIKKMEEIVRKRDSILEDDELSVHEKNELIEKLDFDNCSIEDLGIDFILPGYNVELMKNGKHTGITIRNLHQYTSLVSHWLLIEGVSRQMESLREGFESVFPVSNLRMFQPEELEAVFCGSPRDSLGGWDVKTLMDCCRPDHGYTADSKAIRLLFEVLSSYNREEQRSFVQFLTGSPRLPVGGFKALSPPLTVVRKTLEPNMNPDDFLPSVMTCVNYLKLPDYSSIEVMREKLRMAASEGQHSFYLS